MKDFIEIIKIVHPNGNELSVIYEKGTFYARMGKMVFFQNEDYETVRSVII